MATSTFYPLKCVARVTGLMSKQDLEKVDPCFYFHQLFLFRLKLLNPNQNKKDYNNSQVSKPTTERSKYWYWNYFTCPQINWWIWTTTIQVFLGFKRIVQHSYLPSWVQWEGCKTVVQATQQIHISQNVKLFRKVSNFSAFTVGFYHWFLFMWGTLNCQCAQDVLSVNKQLTLPLFWMCVPSLAHCCVRLWPMITLAGQLPFESSRILFSWTPPWWADSQQADLFGG